MSEIHNKIKQDPDKATKKQKIHGYDFLTL